MIKVIIALAIILAITAFYLTTRNTKKKPMDPKIIEDESQIGWPEEAKILQKKMSKLLEQMKKDPNNLELNDEFDELMIRFKKIIENT